MSVHLMINGELAAELKPESDAALGRSLDELIRGRVSTFTMRVISPNVFQWAERQRINALSGSGNSMLPIKFVFSTSVEYGVRGSVSLPATNEENAINPVKVTPIDGLPTNEVGGIQDRLNLIIDRITLIGDRQMASEQDFKNAFDRSEAALANIAADIRRIGENTSVDMTQEQVNAQKARALQIAEALETLAAQNPEPTEPVEPVEPAPEVPIINPDNPNQ